MAVGGVNIDNVDKFFKAGASAVGVGGGLIKNDLIKNECFDEITEIVSKFVITVKKATTI